MKDNILIKPGDIKYFDSFHKLFDEVAAEGKWLSRLNAFPYVDCKNFVSKTIEDGTPFLFLYKDEEVIGWCDAQPKEENTGSFAMGIKKEYREMGYGRKLASEIIRLSKEYGYKKLILEVRALNLRAQNLYKSLGFKEIDYIKDGLELNGIKYDYLIMKLDL